METNHSNTPLQLLLAVLTRNKKKTIGIIVMIILVVSGGFFLKNFIQEKREQAMFEKSFEHFLNIVGEYKCSDFTLLLNADGTVCLTKEEDHTRHLGYWKERSEDAPIEISFSDSFKMTIGSDWDSYIYSLYFYKNTLWKNLDAFRSNDRSRSVTLKKIESSSK